MAKFNSEIPYDLIQQFSYLEDNLDDIFGEMTSVGAKVVFNNVISNMKKSFKTTRSLEQGLKITRVYKTPSDDGINTKVGFYGYDSQTMSKKYPKGIPIPLKALAREYGTPTEAKKPFFRKSFNKSQIEEEMLKVQNKYIKGDE